MKSMYEIKEKKKKLVGWLKTCDDDEMREAFVQQIKMIDWIFGDDI